MELFETILRATAESSDVPGLQYGIVADTNDPLNLQRVQVYDQAKGGQFKSDWLMRGLPFTGYSPPIPKLGDLVIIGYIGGDPHHGCYVGLVVNNNNTPVGADTDLTLVLGPTEMSIKIDGSISIKTKTIKVQADSIEMLAGSLTIAGKQVATVGAVDSRGDTLVTKGW